MKNSPQQQQRYYELGEAYFWFSAHYDIVMKVAAPWFKSRQGEGKVRILDAGCGCGNFLERLRARGEVVGLDYSLEALGFCQKKGTSEVVQSSLEQLPFLSHTFDFIFALQIIEHIEDDVRALKELYRILKPGGFLILSVPAFMFLYGAHDEKYGHFRRYTKSDFQKALVQSGGFTVKLSRYFNFSAVAPLYLLRLWKKMTHNKTDDFHHTGIFLNSCLRRFLNLENSLELIINPPLGTFLLLVLRKDE